MVTVRHRKCARHLAKRRVSKTIEDFYMIASLVPRVRTDHASSWISLSTWRRPLGPRNSATVNSPFASAFIPGRSWPA